MEPSPALRTAAVLVLILLAAGLVVWGYAVLTRPASGPLLLEDAQPPREPDLVVHVCGQVKRPGIYRFRFGARAYQAIERAGGATAQADPNAINLAAEVSDGERLYLPSKEEAESSGDRQPATGDRGTATRSRQSAIGGRRPAAINLQRAAGLKTPPKNPISLSTASLEQLEKLPGIGPGYAQRIIVYRQQLRAREHRGFARVDELLQVPGIGPRKFDLVRPYVRP